MFDPIWVLRSCKTVLSLLVSPFNLIVCATFSDTPSPQRTESFQLKSRDSGSQHWDIKYGVLGPFIQTPYLLDIYVLPP